MAVETAEDRAAYLADFGVGVTWRGSTFLALFDRPSTTIAGLAETDIVDRHPTLCFPGSDLPSGAAEDDPVVIVDEFAVTHLRCKSIRPDGTGFVAVDLKT